ncbi:uncharacterized protein LOC127714937 isoform X2 [Mytilus californianus]|uniref:uncharacterized protein LOC127714937 isoform X2 n=1 Tax=Mytilus californianus TaxID=6549 RepID=UPI00224624EA|nr:uncharacterized protein LOC127714937 isoform X2 [Mytilus californianus]
MSLSTLRNNFYRIATLIIDHGADVMRSLLDQFIKKKYNISLKDFVAKNQHELYHQFNNGICCQCSKHYHRPYKQVISSWQMDTLFETNGPKLLCHKPSSKCEYCCSTVKQNLQINDLDITLLNFFLVTYFEEEFWRNCLTDGLSFHDFLNINKHDIFHLVQLNVPCCLCMNNPDYTVMVATGKDRLNDVEWEAMFATTDQYSAHSKTCVDHRNPCSVSATIGINPSSLNGRARMTILSKFCIMMKHIDQLVHARNTVFAHAIKGELTDDNFREFWVEIENSILYLAKITNTDLELTQRILELREFSPKEAIYLEMQCLALRQVQKDEQVIQESRNIQGTVESLAEKIDARLQEIQLQITNSKTHSTYIKESDLSGNSAWYSDEYDDAHKNETKKGCSVGYKDGYEDAHRNGTKKRCSVGYKGFDLVCCILLFALPFSMFLFGATSLQACPAKGYIPIYLLVASIFDCLGFMANCPYLGWVIFNNRQPDGLQKCKVNPLVWILNGFLLSWFIAGNVWVYGTYGHFSVDAAHADYCDPTVYWFSFLAVTSINILFVVVCIIICATRCIAYHKSD